MRRRLLTAALLFTAAAAVAMPADPALLARLGRTRVAELQNAGLSAKATWDDFHAPLLLSRDAGKAQRASGVGTCLYILWQFADHAADEAAHPSSAYEDLFLSTGTHPTGSMNDFYREASHGQFGIDGDVVGWTTASSTYASYANGDGSQDAYTCQAMLRDAIAELDPLIDFSQYDNDGPDGIPDSGDDDGRVDALFFIHAGPGEESTGAATDIWSHAWALSSGGDTQDGVSVYRYSVEPEETPEEEIMTVGVFCHEYGHVLGLPDLYDTDYSSSGIGEYGLMSGGSWCHRPGDARGSRPSQMCAWSKWKLGWLDPVEITADQTGLVLPPSATNAVAYRMWHAGQEGGDRFFLIENRQNVGFDEGLVRRQVMHDLPLAHGLAIYRVDDALSSNTADNHRLVDVVDASPWFHADGSWHETHDGPVDYDNWLSLTTNTRGDNGDLWPGFTAFNADSTEWAGPRDRDRFAADTVPAAVDFACESVGVTLSNIREEGLDVVLDVALDAGGTIYEPFAGPLVWDFESGIDGWEFCESRAHLDFDQGDGCSGLGGLWFGQTGWDNCDGVGYGNNWDDSAWITVAVNPAGPVLVNLEHRYAVEPGYDYCHVEARPAISGQAWTELASFDGESGCRTDQWTVPSSLLAEATPDGETFAVIQIRLRLTSDGGWSSEDGSYCGIGWWVDRLEVVHETLTAVDHAPGLDLAALAPANPNPFNPSTTLKYRVPAGATSVRLDVMDARGRLVRSLVAENPGAGWQSVRWDGRDRGGRMAASGLYFARLAVDGAAQVQKMALLK